MENQSNPPTEQPASCPICGPAGQVGPECQIDFEAVKLKWRQCTKCHTVFLIWHDSKVHGIMTNGQTGEPMGVMFLKDMPKIITPGLASVSRSRRPS